MEDLIQKSKVAQFNDRDTGNFDAGMQSMNLGSIIVNPMGSHQVKLAGH